MAEIGNLKIENFHRTKVLGTIDPDAGDFPSVGNTALLEDISGFPDLSEATPGYFYLTLVDEVDGHVEIVKVTDMDTATNTATFERDPEFGGVALGLPSSLVGFSYGARAETWFTAAHFQAIQDYFNSIPGGTGDMNADDFTLRVYNSAMALMAIGDEAGDGSISEGLDANYYIKEASIHGDKLADNALVTRHFNSVTPQILSEALISVAAAKLTGDISLSRILNALSRTIEGDITSAPLNFSNIKYSTQDLGVSPTPPSGGEDGDIYIEWEG